MVMTAGAIGAAGLWARKSGCRKRPSEYYSSRVTRRDAQAVGSGTLGEIFVLRWSKNRWRSPSIIIIGDRRRAFRAVAHSDLNQVISNC